MSVLLLDIFCKAVDCFFQYHQKNVSKVFPHYKSLTIRSMITIPSSPTLYAATTETRRVTGYDTGRSRFNSRKKQETFLYTLVSRSGLGPTQPSIQCVLGSLSPVVKRPVCEADHSLPFRSEVKIGRTISRLPHTSSWRGA
jgi:hypothetical protein